VQQRNHLAFESFSLGSAGARSEGSYLSVHQVLPLDFFAVIGEQLAWKSLLVFVVLVDCVVERVACMRALTCDCRSYCRSLELEIWTVAMASASMTAVSLQACSASIATVSPASSVRLSSPASLGGVRLNVAHSASFARYGVLCAHDHFFFFVIARGL
jgi:hypothetical protein